MKLKKNKQMKIYLLQQNSYQIHIARQFGRKNTQHLLSKVLCFCATLG